MQSGREVPREVISPMWVAGYRQRLDRALTEVRKSRQRADIYKQVVRHIAARYAEVFPDQRPITEVKLLNAVWRTDELTMTHPEGLWRVPPAEALDRKHVSTLAHYRLVGTKWTDAATPKKAKTPATKAAPPVAVAVPKNQSPPRASPAGLQRRLHRHRKLRHRHTCSSRALRRNLPYRRRAPG